MSWSNDVISILIIILNMFIILTTTPATTTMRCPAARKHKPAKQCVHPFARTDIKNLRWSANGLWSTKFSIDLCVCLMPFVHSTLEDQFVPHLSAVLWTATQWVCLNSTDGSPKDIPAFQLLCGSIRYEKWDFCRIFSHEKRWAWIQFDNLFGLTICYNSSGCSLEMKTVEFFFAKVAFTFL